MISCCSLSYEGGGESSIFGLSFNGCKMAIWYGGGSIFGTCKKDWTHITSLTWALTLTNGLILIANSQQNNNKLLVADALCLWLEMWDFYMWLMLVHMRYFDIGYICCDGTELWRWHTDISWSTAQTNRASGHKERCRKCTEDKYLEATSLEC